MSTYLRVLTQVANGRGPDRIAAELGRREDAVRGMLETMHRRGHVRRIDCEDGACAACPMAESCGGAMGTPVQYVVAADGWDLIEESTASH